MKYTGKISYPFYYPISSLISPICKFFIFNHFYLIFTFFMLIFVLGFWMGSFSTIFMVITFSTSFPKPFSVSQIKILIERIVPYTL